MSQGNLINTDKPLASLSTKRRSGQPVIVPLEAMHKGLSGTDTEQTGAHIDQEHADKQPLEAQVKPPKLGDLLDDLDQKFDKLHAAHKVARLGSPIAGVIKRLFEIKQQLKEKITKLGLDSNEAPLIQAEGKVDQAAQVQSKPHEEEKGASQPQPQAAGDAGPENLLDDLTAMQDALLEIESDAMNRGGVFAGNLKKRCVPSGQATCRELLEQCHDMIDVLLTTETQL